MIVKYSAFIVPHGGEGYNNCQDRFLINKDTCSFGVADGVSQSFSPSTWAEIVCENFVNNPEDFVSEDETKWKNQNIACSHFASKTQQEQSELSENEKFFFELQKEKYEFAACTFVGLHISHKDCKVICIGDSYLVACNNGKIIDTVPTVKNSGFDNFPDYLSSNGKNNGKIRVKDIDFDIVTSLFIMTDALAEWLLTGSEEGKIGQLMNINTHEDFVAFVEEERISHRLKDDDTTLVRICIEKDFSEQIVFVPEAIDDINKLKKDDISLVTVETPEKEEPKKVVREPEVKSNSGDTILQEAQNLCAKYKKDGKKFFSESDVDSAMDILGKLVMRLKYSSSSCNNNHISEKQFNTLSQKYNELLQKNKNLLSDIEKLTKKRFFW